ncbi:MAG: hypothetical protein K2Q34_00730 [Alphaproteobacteria bacterium]|nr:hypothetical protein [Alphaproteobacteria bacterium]
MQLMRHSDAQHQIFQFGMGVRDMQFYWQRLKTERSETLGKGRYPELTGRCQLVWKRNPNGKKELMDVTRNKRKRYKLLKRTLCTPRSWSASGIT